MLRVYIIAFITCFNCLLSLDGSQYHLQNLCDMNVLTSCSCISIDSENTAFNHGNCLYKSNICKVSGQLSQVSTAYCVNLALLAFSYTYMLLIASKIELQMEILRMLSPLFLRENLLELFYPMLALLALEPFYLVIILGMDSPFILVCGHFIIVPSK